MKYDAQAVLDFGKLRLAATYSIPLIYLSCVHCLLDTSLEFVNDMSCARAGKRLSPQPITARRYFSNALVLLISVQILVALFPLYGFEKLIAANRSKPAKPVSPFQNPPSIPALVVCTFYCRVCRLYCFLINAIYHSVSAHTFKCLWVYAIQ